MIVAFRDGRLEERLRTLAQFPALQRPAVRRVIIWIAVLALLAGLVLAIRSQPDLLTDLSWPPIIAILLLAIPLVIGLNVVEYSLSGRMLGRRIGPLDSLEIVVVGAAANMLPIPGSTLVRMAALKAAGAGFGQGAMAVGLVFLVWLAVSAIYSGLWILLAGALWIGLVCVAAGLVMLALVVGGATRLERGQPTISWVVLVRIALVFVEGGRFYLTFLAFGIDASFAQSSAFVVTGVLGSALSVVPAGLGLRETIAAALGPVVGIAAATGFLAAALNRVLDMTVVLPLAFLLALRRRNGGSPRSILA